MLLENGRCDACQARFAPGALLRGLPCDHWFHQPCIDRWLLTRLPACPTCGTSVLPSASNAAAAAADDAAATSTPSFSATSPGVSEDASEIVRHSSVPGLAHGSYALGSTRPARTSLARRTDARTRRNPTPQPLPPPQAPAAAAVLPPFEIVGHTQRVLPRLDAIPRRVAAPLNVAAVGLTAAAASPDHP
ncbi:hypothetical protein HK405_001877, partial [Cladochytrium tenue]